MNPQIININYSSAFTEEGNDIFGNEFIEAFNSFPNIKIKIEKEHHAIDRPREDGVVGFSFFQIWFNNEYLSDILEESLHLEVCKSISKFMQLMIDISTKIYLSDREYIFLKIQFHTTDGYFLNFTFKVFNEVSTIEKQLKSSFLLLYDYLKLKRNNLTKKAIKKTFVTDTKNIYFYFNADSDNWEIENILITLAKSVESSSMDSRGSKYDKLYNRRDLSHPIIMKNNWVLPVKGGNHFMNKPNDIGLYSSISTKALARSRSLFEKITNQKRLMQYNFDAEYYDYFEEVITAIIFGYTTIECLVNIIIPQGKFYVKKGGKVGLYSHFTREGIEQNISLQEKVNEVLPQILLIQKLNTQPWWNKFIELEKLRNKIIHTKQSSYEVRYKDFLDTSIFEIVEVHLSVINFYAEELTRIGNRSINELPVGFGHDVVYPTLTEKKHFDNLFEQLINPSRNTAPVNKRKIPGKKGKTY